MRKQKESKLCALIVVLLTIAGSVVSASELKFWYQQPADDWEREALPIGNGHMGGMLFGRYDQERIHFNVDSLWTGDGKKRGDYQSFGYVLVKLEDSTKPTDYRRELDIERAVHTTSYRQGKALITQQAFCSYPAKVLVWRLTADNPKGISGQVFLYDDHGAVPEAVGEKVLYCRGKLENGLPYESRIQVECKGGSAEVIHKEAQTTFHYLPGRLYKKDEWPKDRQVVAPRTICFENCTELTVYLAADTGYNADFNRGWFDDVPTAEIKARIDAAGKRDYQELLDEHVKDHRSLFDRCDVRIEGTDASKAEVPTDQRLLKDKNAPLRDPDLERLMFQYGRYMLIASSRPGSLPANLQGVWNMSNDPAWGCDYHMNINLQMNYWPAELTGLSECHLPVFDWMWSQKEAWRENMSAMRGHNKDVRGWTALRELDIYGGWRAKQNLGCEWMAQDFWEHYAFTMNEEFLRSRAYPIFKELCEYRDDMLIRREDGTLVTPESESSEHGPTLEAISSDLILLYELFTIYMDTCDILGVDADYRKHIAGLREKLMRPRIGSWGQLQEWEFDYDVNPADPATMSRIEEAAKKHKGKKIGARHRHLSHLVGFYPGCQMTLEGTPELAEAVRVALVARGDGSCSWSRVWKSALWARLGDGNKALPALDSLKFPPNGFGILAVFQIDANLGHTAAVVEMLIQSHQGFVELLPALPDAWATGEARGLGARGGFTVDMKWADGKLEKAVIHSKAGEKCRLRYGDREVVFKVKKGESVMLDGELLRTEGSES